MRSNSFIVYTAVIALIGFIILAFMLSVAGLGAGANAVIAIIYMGICYFIIKPIYSAKKEGDKLVEETNSLFMENAMHKEGLQGVGYEKCSILIRDENILIKTNNNDFSIKYDKIFNAISTNEFEIVQQYKTEIRNKGTMGKAALGALLLGPTGAIIGAAGSSKSTATTQTINNHELRAKYLVISYKKGDDIACISFEGVGYSNFERLQDEINKRIPKDENEGPIEL